MDLWLASQAIQFNLTFVTNNTRHFQDIPGLTLTKLQ